MTKNKTILEKVSWDIIEGLFEDFNQERKEILAYGLMALLSTVVGFLIIIIFSSLFGVLKLALIAAVTASAIRIFAGGVHVSSYKGCALTGGFVFTLSGVAADWLGSQLQEPNQYMLLFWLTFIIGILIIYLYAPAEVVEKPIHSREKYIRMKRYSFLIFFAICFAYLLILLKADANKLVLSGLLGMLWQMFTLTPLAYKLFRRQYIRGD